LFCDTHIDKQLQALKGRAIHLSKGQIWGSSTSAEETASHFKENKLFLNITYGIRDLSKPLMAGDN